MVSRFLRSYLYVFRRYPALISMGVIVIVVQLGWSAVMVILPLYIKHHLHRSSMIGPVLLAFLGVETLLKPPLGELGDRVGRKPMLLGGCVTAMVAMLGLHYLDHPAWLFPLMALNGVAAAAIWPAVSAYMGERVPRDDKAAAMSVFEGGYLVGFGFGGAAGLFLGGVYGNRTVFLVSASLFLLAAAMGAAVIKSGRYLEQVSHFDEYDTVPEVRAQFARGLALLREAPMLPRLMGVYVMSQFATTALMPIVTLYGEQELGRTEQEMAILFIGPAVVIAVLGVAMGRLADQMGKVRAIFVSYCMAATFLTIMFLARTPEPGKVVSVNGREAWIARERKKNIIVGETLSVRHEGVQVALARVKSLEQGGFVVELDQAGRVRRNDRVFVKAALWQIVALLVGLTLLGIAYALGAPALLGLGSEVAPDGKQGQALGLMNAAQGVGSCLGIVTGPVVYEHVAPQAPIVMAGIVYLACIAFTRMFVREARPAATRGPAEVRAEVPVLKGK